MTRAPLLLFAGLVAPLVAASLPVQAQEAPPPRILSDPTFLTYRGEISLATGYTYSAEDSTSFTFAGAPTATSRSTSNLFRTEAAYGVTNDFSLRAALGYEFDGGRTVQPVNRPAVSLGESGAADPSFGLTWRVVNRRHSPVTIDLLADYSPDVFAATSATAAQPASDGRGSQEFNARISVGHQARLFTIRGVFGGEWQSANRVVNPANGAATQASEFWTPWFGINTQARLAPRFSLNVDAAFDFPGDRTVFNGLTGATAISHLGDDQTVGASLNYHFLPNRLVGRIGYVHTFYSGSALDYPANAAANLRLSRSANTVDATVTYVFR